MIIKSANLIGKKLNILILIISLLLDFGILGALIAIVIISLNFNTDNHYIVFIILSILSTVSIIDIIEIIRKKENIAFFLAKKLSRSRINNTTLKLNATQKVFCESVYGLKDKSSYIYVYGKPNRGKSTAVIYLLDGFSQNSNSIDEIPWINNFTFIDCTSNKKEILDYFLVDNSVNNRIQQFSNSIIVIDNIENLGKAFFEENLGLFSSYKSFFIIIENTRNNCPMYKLDKLGRALLTYDFNSSVIGIKPIVNLLEKLKGMNHNEKNVFFSLYFLTISSEFANIDEIKKIIKINIFSLYKALYKIEQANIFVSFKFNRRYFYCYNRNYINEIGEICQGFAEYYQILETFIKSNAVDSEVRWICFIRSGKEIILNFSEKERVRLFRKALYNGKYSELYNELLSCIHKEPCKANLFLYERGFLAYYIGNHNEATNIFLKLIETFHTDNEKKEMMLHIIESSHGNPDKNNMDLIYSFIRKMENTNDFYSLCALYWKNHIDTEKGLFAFSTFENIRKCIKQYSKYKDNPLYKSIIHRSFLDEIRCLHILGYRPSNGFFAEYFNFLKTCSVSRSEYYSNLYVEANTIHYIYLIDMLLKNNFSSEDLLNEVQKAEIFYNKALSSSYSDEKSKRATKIKLLDLRMFYNDFDYEDTIKQINMFRIHSQINDVKVHEAFCETLLIKAKILNPNNISNDYGFSIGNELKNEIFQHYKVGYDIYQKYNNTYGLLRLDLLICLLNLLDAEFENKEKITMLKTFKETLNNNPKEYRIIDWILERYEKNTCSPMTILSIIRAYSIILQ